MRKIRMGVIGVGNMGLVHCRNILAGKTPEISLACVADRNPERLAWLRQELPADTSFFTDGDALIDQGDLDAVLIAVPHYDHPRLAIRAFERGLHVLSEKPAGVYCAQVHEMNRAAAQSGKVFGMMYNQRTNALYRKMHEMMQSGELGAIRRVSWIITDWFRTQHYYDSGAWRATWAGEGGGVLLNQCPHNLDLLQWICGLPTRVRAFCYEDKWHDIEVEDEVTAHLEFALGASGIFVTSTGEMPGTNRFEIACEGGKLVSEGGELTLWRNERNTQEIIDCSDCNYVVPELRPETVPTDGENPQHVGVMNAFAGAVLRGEPLVAPGEEGIRGLMLSNAMHLSSWLGRPVDLPVDERLFLSELDARRANSRAKDVECRYIEAEGNYGS